MTVRPFQIDPDVARAQTPPGELYGGADWHDAMCDRLWPRAWQLAPVPRHAPEPEHAWPFVHVPGALEEPAVLTRDRDGRRRCLSNVCTHRGAIVVEQPGPTKTLRCRYHGRCFTLDGGFRSAPGFEDAADFPTESDDLARLELGEWSGFAFASLRPRVSFDDWIEPVRARFGTLQDAAWPGAPHVEKVYELEANWSLWVDNALEGFHIRWVHRSLAATIDVEDYTVELFDHGCVQIATARPGEPCFDLAPGHPDHGRRVAGYFIWLFPGTMFNFYPWGASINLVEPVAPTHTRIRYLTYVSDESRLGSGAGGDLDTVELEDQAIVRSAQRGVRARSHRLGRYAPRREVGVHRFHRLLAEYLFDREPMPERIDL